MTPVRFRLRWAVAAALGVVCATLPHPAAAQYFGQNKVQYRAFHYVVLATEHFDIYYDRPDSTAAARAGRMAERWYTRLSRALGHELSGRQPLVFYGSHPDFEQTNAIPGQLSDATGGVTEFLKRRIVLPAAATLAETDHVIGHELVHAFQYDMTGSGRGGFSFAVPGAARLPLWFVEGMAEYLSLGADDPNTAMWMRDAAARKDLPSYNGLTNGRYFPYRYGQALLAYVGGRWGDRAIGRILVEAGRRQGARLDSAMAGVIGISADSLVRDWHAATTADEQAVAALTTPPDSAGRPLFRNDHERATIEVAPALSPDGRRVLFLSARDLFSIDLYLADVATGRILRRVTRTAVDPHFESLAFVQSAGAWSPDGRRFALAAVSKGRPVITILDTGDFHTLEEIPLPGLGEAYGPTWSPDGGRVAFSALTGGVTDLFVLDLATRAVTRLTDDPYADLMPAWSPDGASIAFVTDRFGTRLDDLAYGNERLALIDPATRAIRELPGQETGGHIAPQWSPDGQALYCVASPAGIPQVYRVDLAAARWTRLTRVSTGVSGITRLSPALAVARDTLAIVAGIFDKDGERLFRLAAEPGEPGAPDSALAALRPGVLPPAARPDTGLVALRSEPAVGLPAGTAFSRHPYRPGLALDYIAPPSLGFAAGSGGVAVGGGTGLYWSDMLGNRQLATLFSLDTSGGKPLNNLTLLAGYENLRSRWDWGVTAGQQSYLSQAFATDYGTYDGAPAVREQTYRYWQIDRQLSGVARYPLSRVFRVEMGAGVRHVSFDSQLESRIYDEATGALLEQTTGAVAGDSLPGLLFGTTTGALVYDSSVFGGASPVLGQSWRLEASPTFGDLGYVGLLGDARRYQMLSRSVVLAGRVLHFGRYGRSAENGALQPLYVGYPWLVHGYDVGSFSSGADEATFERLIGSRIGVANLELRLELLGPLGVIRSRAVPPVELAAFYDAGVAWSSDSSPALFGGQRDGVTSHGVALRANLFGFAVGEVALAHPNDRADRSWRWEFNLQPGF